MQRILIWLAKAPVILYRYGISPFTPISCRFQPTCSAYAMEAIDSHGALKGSILAMRRLARCRPGGDSGYDPVPVAKRPYS
ncbi:MAG: membrane protein insertion efficiency factor YidD [Rhodospirillales bacterium]